MHNGSVHCKTHSRIQRTNSTHFNVFTSLLPSSQYPRVGLLQGAYLTIQVSDQPGNEASFRMLRSAHACTVLGYDFLRRCGSLAEARRQGGVFKEVCSNPLLGFIHRLAIHFECPTVASGPLTSLPLRITAVQMSLLAGALNPAERAHVSGLRCCGFAAFGRKTY